MRPTQGYTLLEMIVVVALLGLATAMVAPAGYRMVASWRESTDVQTVLKTISQLPMQARDAGRELRLLPDSGDARVVTFAPGSTDSRPSISDLAMVPLPDGWSLQLDSPLVIRANGACSGSTGTLITRRQRLTLQIQAPFCRTRSLPAGSRPE